MAERLFISRHAAARLCGVRLQTFNEWVTTGFAPSCTDPVTHKVRISRPALVAWATSLDDRQAS